MSPQSLVTRCPQTPIKEFGPDHAALLDLESGDFFQLDSVTLFVWQRLDGTCTLQELAQQLATHYQTSAPEALTDLLEFAADLVERRLARVTG
jgi:hypothetical protein